MPERYIIRIFLFLLIIMVYASTGCASGNKGKSISKRSQSSKVSASQLGRNKYFFSTSYQKKLTKAYKKR